MSEGHGIPHTEGPLAKRVALLISVLALFLALSETLAKSSQTNAISANVEASNLWAFFQAKTIRQTSVRTMTEALGLVRAAAADPQRQEAVDKQLDSWNKTVARWESEPETGEGRKELMARAKSAEEVRDLAMSRYHAYEFGSAALQIGIVLASAAVITEVALLAGAGGLLGVIGLGFIAVGLFAPDLMHFGH